MAEELVEVEAGCEPAQLQAAIDDALALRRFVNGWTIQGLAKAVGAPERDVSNEMHRRARAGVVAA